MTTLTTVRCLGDAARAARQQDNGSGFPMNGETSTLTSTNNLPAAPVQGKQPGKGSSRTPAPKTTISALLDQVRNEELDPTPGRGPQTSTPLPDSSVADHGNGNSDQGMCLRKVFCQDLGLQNSDVHAHDTMEPGTVAQTTGANSTDLPERPRKLTNSTVDVFGAPTGLSTMIPEKSVRVSDVPTNSDVLKRPEKCTPPETNVHRTGNGMLLMWTPQL